jgi:hypothetical protein
MVRTIARKEDGVMSRRFATWLAALAVACGGTGYVAAQIIAADHPSGGAHPLAVVNG